MVGYIHVIKETSSMSAPDDIGQELDQLIAKHDRLSTIDFTIAQALIVIGILASALAGITALIALVPRWLSALIAAMPAVIIVIGQSFQFHIRASCHRAFAVKANQLRRDRQNGVDRETIARKLEALEEAYDKCFPTLSFTFRGGENDSQTNA